MINSKYSGFLLALLGGLLLWAAWPTSPLTFLIFIAWLPMFRLTEQVTNWKKFLGYTFITVILWNVLTTWWIANSTIPGGISAFLVNSLIMCIPWLLYFFFRRYFNLLISGMALAACWVAYEFLHHNWDLSWPWLTLGNAFAMHPEWVQWYEFTGASGGTLWILISNILIFQVFEKYRAGGRSTGYFKSLLIWIAVLALPILVSRLITINPLVEQNKYNVVVVQPNVDPYTVKFAAGSQEAQLQKLIALSQQQIDANTALVVWPETAIPFQADEARLADNMLLEPVWNFLKVHPQVNLLTGLEGVRLFDHKNSRTARQVPGGDGYYESYNSALLTNGHEFRIYHKSKLVPGVEVLPSFLGFMSPLFDKFGGTTGGYTTDTATLPLASFNRSFQVAPAICYESIYSDYLTGFTRRGATLICVITNDGWWGNTQGYKQHMQYARLRAIENRKWVARSANTGISCFIDPAGNIIQRLPWAQQGVIKQDITAYAGATFYSRHGDYLSRIFSIVAAGFFLLLLVKAAVKPSRKRFL